jgi:glycosyltransferase involved in cell wall biosynthesis
MKKINLYSPVCYTGYGVAGYNIGIALNNYFDVTIFPMGMIENINPNNKNILEKCINKTENYDPSAPCLKIYHAYDLAPKIGNGEYFVYPFFELDTLSKMERHNLSCCDKIFTSSDWYKNVLIKNNIKTPISVIPLGVDLSIFDYKLSEQIENKNEKYIFCTIGKWEIRKGYDILLDLFMKAFSKKDDVELWICASSDNGYISQEEKSQWHHMYQNNEYADKIKIFPPLKTHADIAKLISYTDCGLYISRAEGWNLELLETMAMNKPVIASNYSAHTQFCNNDNSYLVDIEDSEPAYDGKFFRGQGNWAKIDTNQIDQIISHMRELYNNRIITNPNGIKTAEKFSWDNSAKAIFNSV